METNHFYSRVRQRGLGRREDIKLILDCGTPEEVVGGAVRVRLTKKDRNNEISRRKREIQALERLTGRAVILRDGLLITAY